MPTVAPDEWRLYKLCRPDAIYAYFYRSEAPGEPVRFLVFGLNADRRRVLEGLAKGAIVPDEIVQILQRGRL